MLIISEKKLSEYKFNKYKVYSKEPLAEGVECFSSSKSFKNDEPFYITSVNTAHIRHDNGRFYYTEEDLSTTVDWFPAHIIPIGSTFKQCSKRRRKLNISSDKCIVDVSGLPAFSNCTNEDITVNDYKFYLTLFNDYTVEQCQFERHHLYDAQFKSSKYDLPAKLQNSEFLKSKDFTMINSHRETEESVKVGLVLKENLAETDRNIEYGEVYVNMDNKISIIWK